MRDLLTSLTTNLHILVVSVLLVGMGLGIVNNPADNSTAKEHSVVISFSDGPEQGQHQPVAAPTTLGGNYDGNTLSGGRPRL